MRLAGSVPIAASSASTWDLVVDPLALAGCMPGVREVRQVDERTFAGGIVAAVGPIEGDFSFTSVITRAEFPDLEVELDGVDSVTKSHLTAAVHVTLAPAGGATTLTYRADIAVQGRLAILGEMILRATATAMVGQVTGCLKHRLERPADEPVAAVDP